MNSWEDFYNASRDSSWPECKQIEDFVNLPSKIQLEIVQDHLFDKKTSALTDKFRHIDNNFPNFLTNLEEIKQIIGPSNSLMNSQDAIFLYSIIWSKRPKNVLEIGRHHGWSSTIIFGALEDIGDGHLYTVDIKDNTNDTIKSIINSRTTFITSPSADILSLNEINRARFEIVFIDGDHEYDPVLTDLQNTYKITTDEAWFLLHDSNMVGVQDAADMFLSQVNNIIDCGVYGEKIRLLYKKGVA